MMTKNKIQSSRLLKALVVVAGFTQVAACSSSADAEADTTDNFPQHQVTQVAEGLNHPWGVVALPDNRLLVTERAGDVRIVENGELSAPVANVPQSYVRSQGGLLDVVLHPNYAQNQWIYFTQAYGDAKANATRLFRAKLEGNSLVDVQTLFTVSPMKKTPAHYGGRLTFLPDGTLVLATGDGYNYREDAQKGDSLMGKMIRLNDDGSIPKDNPFVNDPDVRDEVYTLGHRNPQGVAFDEKRQILYANEHGPKGGDEVNILEPGKNYGWPVITYGVDYSGAQITPYTEYEGMEQPFINWTPSIAPSSLEVYYGEMFPEINGDLLTTALKFQELRWVKMDGNEVESQHSLLKERNERFRDLAIGNQGEIYLLTDSPNGKILKLSR